MPKISRVLAFAALSAIAAAHPAVAQETPTAAEDTQDQASPEVVVTAQFRETASAGHPARNHPR